MNSDLTPMELVKKFAPEFARNQMEEKQLLFEHQNYQQVPAKYKLLTGIAVAAALGSQTCTEMWVKMARSQGVSAAEITEAMMVARYMKQATVNDTISSSLQKLAEEESHEG